MYYKYLNYLIRHRWFVMLACFREGLYWQGLIHDWSKFLPSEFVPYAWYFYGEKFPSIYEYHGDHRNFALNSGYYKERVERDFNRAWLAHQHRNPHHWQHWVLREDSGNTLVLPMPHKYRVEMLCDWQGAGRAIHGRYDASDPYGETREWYAKNAEKMMLHDETRAWVEAALGIERGEVGHDLHLSLQQHRRQANHRHHHHRGGSMTQETLETIKTVANVVHALGVFAVLCIIVWRIFK